MKLSNDTRVVLGNFATINKGIKVNPGNKLNTVSMNKTILGKAEVAEIFDHGFCIYDLPEFLSALSMFGDPELTFDDEFVTIQEGNTKLRYTYADENVIIVAPDKEITCNKDIVFPFSADILERVSKGSAILDLPNLVFERSEDSGIRVLATDVKDNSSNEVKIEISPDDCDVIPDNAFKMVFKFENLRLLSRDYTVTIDKAGIAHFVSPDLEYFIAVEQNESTFN